MGLKRFRARISIQKKFKTTFSSEFYRKVSHPDLNVPESQNAMIGNPAQLQSTSILKDSIQPIDQKEVQNGNTKKEFNNPLPNQTKNVFEASGSRSGANVISTEFMGDSYSQSLSGAHNSDTESKKKQELITKERALSENELEI